MARDPMRLSGDMSSEEQKDHARKLLDEFDAANKYTDQDFDKMLIAIYSHDGYPFMDQFEYMDAVFHNREVEILRNEYFKGKKSRC